MLYPSDDDARRVIDEIAAETGLPTDDPVRFGGGPAVARGPRGGRRAAVGEGRAAGRLGRAAAGDPLLRHEVLRLALRDPFLIARSDHGGGHARHDRRRRAAGRSLPGRRRARRGLSRTATTARRSRPCRRSSRCLSTRSASSSRRPMACGPRASGSQAAIRWNGAREVRRSTSALHDLVGKVTGQPVYRLLGLSTDIPPTDFTLGLDEPAVVAERARRAGAFPALKIKVGGPADLATLEAVREVYDKPIRVDANTGWTPEIARAAAAGAGRPRGRADRAAVPRRAGSTGWRDLQAGSPLPIVADESCVTIDDLDALVGVTAGRQRQAREVRRPRAGGADARPGARARLPDVPRLHGGDLGRDRRIGGGRVAGRLGRPRRQPAPRRRAVHGPGARLGPPLAAHRRTGPGGPEARSAG